MRTHRRKLLAWFVIAILVPAVARAQEPAKITVISLKHADPANVIGLIERVFKSTPGLTVEALPKIGGVAIRANAKVTKEVEDFVRELDKSVEPVRKPHGPTKIEGLRIFSNVGKNRVDPEQLDHIIWLIRIIRGEPAEIAFSGARVACGMAPLGGVAYGVGKLDGFRPASFAPGAFGTSNRLTPGAFGGFPTPSGGVLLLPKEPIKPRP